MAQLSYRRHRFPASIIQHAIWLYLRFTLSHRDVEDLLAERGLDISYETVRRWVLKFERQQAEVRFARDSPLEGTGFEPSVPRGKGPTLRVSVLFRPDSSVGGEPTRGDIERLVVSCGTDGSNPVPSREESANHRFLSPHACDRRRRGQ